MDDFNLQNLNESRNEWVARLITMMSPSIFQGLKQIFDDAVKLAISTNQKDKYLMTFQNMLTQIPKWNNDIINNETNRIIESTQCNYIEDLITCVHVIQLKALTCVRVGQNEKDVEINIPKLHDFIHKVYINTARTIYSNIYLFEQEIMPVQIQQNYNKVDQIIKENIIQTIRQSMPIEEILRAYLEETVSKALDEKKNIPPVNLSDDKLVDDNNNIDNQATNTNESTIVKDEDNVQNSKALPNLSDITIPQEQPLEEIQIMANDNTFDTSIKNENEIELCEYNPIENQVPDITNNNDDTLKEHSVTFSGVPDDDEPFSIINDNIGLNDSDVLLGIETLS